MKNKKIQKIIHLKDKRKIACLTSYTTPISRILDRYCDIILVGDSLGSTIYGMKNTRSVNLDMMKRHGKTVVNASKKSFTIIDMPYKSYLNKRSAYNNASSLLKFTGCQSVKLEINEKNIGIVSYLTKRRIKIISGTN